VVAAAIGVVAAVNPIFRGCGAPFSYDTKLEPSKLFQWSLFINFYMTTTLPNKYVQRGVLGPLIISSQSALDTHGLRQSAHRRTLQNVKNRQLCPRLERKHVPQLNSDERVNPVFGQ